MVILTCYSSDCPCNTHYHWYPVCSTIVFLCRQSCSYLLHPLAWLLTHTGNHRPGSSCTVFPLHYSSSALLLVTLLSRMASLLYLEIFQCFFTLFKAQSCQHCWFLSSHLDCLVTGSRVWINCRPFPILWYVTIEYLLSVWIMSTKSTALWLSLLLVC